MKFYVRCMYFVITLTLVLSLSLLVSKEAQATSWQGQWIWEGTNSQANTWMMFKKDFNVNQLGDSATLDIAVDSKYWLWVNNQLVIFEGGLKRGPDPTSTYVDKVDIKDYLTTGDNSISILVWYFGKEGFAHKDSGQGGLYLQGMIGNQPLVSDGTWKVKEAESYLKTSVAGGGEPNYRLAESNVIYDARKELADWYKKDYDTIGWSQAVELGTPPTQPWGNLVTRIIPQWSDSGLKDYESLSVSLPYTTTGTTNIIAQLPYNAQVTPYLKVESTSGHVIRMQTDDYNGGGEKNLRAEYITKEGLQSYESLGWINGHQMTYTVPAGVTIKELKYRETGYATDFEESFSTNDPFLNKLYEKAQRTLYVTMRDNYMDCPDRERAQWWGDAVIELGETFYAMDRRSDQLTKKAILELANWQKGNKVLYSPVPAGNWDKELPVQMLASIGEYGFWYYYMYTGDLETIQQVYPHVKDYLSLWQLDSDGLVQHRAGGWDWADWGSNKDVRIMDNAWYYLALEAGVKMANLLGQEADKISFQQKMTSIENNFNRVLWNGTEYRSPGYHGDTDDRGNGLAVVAGLANPSQYNAITTVLKQHKNASPYMEKYVLEALYMMDKGDVALDRIRNRYNQMINDPNCTTLWERWTKGGNSTYNHAWTGGPLTLLNQYGLGIAPDEAGFTKYHIYPQMGDLTSMETSVPSVIGDIEVRLIRNESTFEMDVTCPTGGEATIGVPKKAFELTNKALDAIKINGQLVWQENQVGSNVQGIQYQGETDRFILFKAEPGTYAFTATPSDESLEPSNQWLNIAKHKAVTASSAYESGGWGKVNLVDESRISTAGSKGYSSIDDIKKNHEEWLQIDLGKVESIGQLILYPRSDEGKLGEGFPVDFEIKISQDGQEWTKVVEKTGYSQPVDSRGESFTFPSQDTRYVGIWANNLRYNTKEDAYFFQLAEVEVYAYEELFIDTFDTDMSKWSNTTNTQLENGSLRIKNNEYLKVSEGDAWTDYTIETDLVLVKGAAGISFRIQDNDNFYMWQLNSNGQLRLHKKVQGVWQVMKEVEAGLTEGGEYNVRIDVINDHIKTFINHQLINEYQDQQFNSGIAGLRQHGNEECLVKEFKVITKE